MSPPPGHQPDVPEPLDVELRASLRGREDLPARRARRRAVDVVGVDESVRPLVDTAVAQLAEELGLARADVVVEAAGPVTWGDSSCGCPEPGRTYPQVPVDGVYLRLVAAGRVFHVHGGGPRGLFVCAG